MNWWQLPIRVVPQEKTAWKVIPVPRTHKTFVHTHLERLCLVSGLFLLLSCTVHQASEESHNVEDALQLEISIDSSNPSDPIATIRFSNEGSRSLAVTRTFGLRDIYLMLEIEHEGVLMPYPAGSQYEIFGNPGYKCIRPGQTSTLVINLNRWYHVIGGEPQPDQQVPLADPPYSFGVSPGSYRIRGVYVSYDEYGERCRIIHGPVRSEWVGFEVRPNEE